MFVFVLSTACTLKEKEHDFTEIKKQESTYYLETNISYPVFPGFDELNNSVSQEVLSRYTNFTQSVENDWIEFNDICKETG